MRPMIIMEQVVISSVTSAVDDKRSESSTNIAEEDTEVMEKEEVDKMSGVTSASSCCKCKLPIPEERERFISRMV